MNKSGWIKLALALVCILTLLPPSPVVAQGEQPSGPVYVVQQGDTLWDIALRFGVSMDDLKRVNGISDPGLLNVGDRLVIPGIEGIDAFLVTRTIEYGETLVSLSRRYQVAPGLITRLNHITSPAELYAGANLVVPESTSLDEAGARATLRAGQSLLELALVHGADPWTLASRNALSGTWTVAPGDVLRLPGQTVEGPGALPEQIAEVEIDPLPLVQGKTTVIRVAAQGGLSLAGTLVDRELNFFPQEDGSYVALQGVHAMLPPGLYPLTLRGTLADGTPLGFSQQVYIASGGYIFEDVLSVDPATLDQAVTQPEDEQWRALSAPVTTEKLWSGVFQFTSPSVFFDCWPSTFGRRRSYNGSEYKYFHTGLDVCGGVGDDIYAPAAGEVVFAGALTVRGNATLINHGQGIYTGYFHQSEILVQVGDRVEPGQLLGRVGATGRVNGPHLHWEIWAGGVQVDPMDWLEREYP
ncbi:MAG: LysM peptidoglycan-binding domain-containing protein [Chloroflexota bacterium]|nr:MAG: LysM peptidoglycan-binding domain-containing protein [Chloroflexota bacterium]